MNQPQRPSPETSPQTSPVTSPQNSDWTTMTVVGLAHTTSHFFHLMLAPLFVWIKPEFGLTYAELGLVMTAFFVVSGIGQALSGFVVDKFGARPVLYGSLLLFAAGAMLASVAQSYPMLVAASALAGLGNCAFHPVDYSILNARIHKTRLGLAYSIHGISGNLGWALAPALLGGVAALAGWRQALWVACALALCTLVLVWIYRAHLDESALKTQAAAASKVGDTTLGFLKLPAVWFSFAFFLSYAVALGGVQSFAGEAARQLHGLPLAWGAAMLSLYMVCSACGMVAGGVLVRNPERCEKVITAGFGAAAVCAITIGIAPVGAMFTMVLVGLMGFCAGIAGPSRDLLVKRAAPPNATGRVYGVVYSGLDVGMAIAPAVFGWMMDHGLPVWVWIGIALFQAVLIVNALRVGAAARRQALVAS